MKAALPSTVTTYSAPRRMFAHSVRRPKQAWREDGIIEYPDITSLYSKESGTQSLNYPVSPHVETSVPGSNERPDDLENDNIQVNVTRKTRYKSKYKTHENEGPELTSADEFFSADEYSPPKTRIRISKKCTVQSGIASGHKTHQTSNFRHSSQPYIPRRGVKTKAPNIANSDLQEERIARSCSNIKRNRPIRLFPSGSSHPRHSNNHSPAMFIDANNPSKPILKSSPPRKPKHNILTDSPCSQDSSSQFRHDNDWNQGLKEEYELLYDSVESTESQHARIKWRNKKKGNELQHVFKKSQERRAGFRGPTNSSQESKYPGQRSEPNSRNMKVGSRYCPTESSTEQDSDSGNVIPSTAPTSIRSSFNPDPSGPSKNEYGYEIAVTGDGYYSEISTEEDEGWKRLGTPKILLRHQHRSEKDYKRSVRTRSATHTVPPMTFHVTDQEIKDTEAVEPGKLKQEMEFQDQSLGLATFNPTHREHASQWPIEQDDDQYSDSESLAAAMAELFVSGIAEGQTRPKRAFKTFSFYLQYEVTRIALAFGLSPDECEHKIPGVIENFAAGLHTAISKRQLWDILKIFGHQLSNDGKMPQPLADEIWSLLKEKNGWSNEIELSGSASYTKNSTHFDFQIQLNPLSLRRKANKFAFRFGSDRFLMLRLPLEPYGIKKDPNLPQEIVEWLVTKKLSLMNRQWRCFYMREDSKKHKETRGYVTEKFLMAYFFAEKGVGLGETTYLAREQLGFAEDAKTSQNEINRYEMSRDELIEWHMPIKKHMDQPFSKIWSRINLGLSSSVPTVTFHPDKVKYVGDRLSPTHNVMNDGCSVCSPKVMRIIREKLGLDETPTAVQARLGGAKGMWFVDPDADRYSEEVSIEITKSQLKFDSHDEDANVDTLDWARLTLFILSYSKELSSAALNIQFVPILAMQKVPFETFEELLGQHLDEDLEQLLKAASDRVTLRHWLSGNGVLSTRQKIGEIQRFDSCIPRSNEEQISMLLDARFEPMECGFLMDKLNTIIEQQCDDILNKLHIRVPSSAVVFCIADPTGTLEEGEVSLQFSKGFVDSVTKTRQECIEGDVLVARNPAHLPTDIQKVRAICPKHAGLRRLKDVIVFSTKGNIPLADMLSGGDYDGDKPWVCWDRRLVEPFTNNRSFRAFKNWKQDKYMQISDPTKRFLNDFPSEPTSFFDEFFRCGFSLSMQQNYLGFCTYLLENYVYSRHPKGGIDKMTILLANLCGVLVDAPKQGIQPTPETVGILQNENKKLGNRPAYRFPKESQNPDGDPRNWHILDRLVLKVGKDKVDEKKKEFEKLKERKASWADPHLTKLYHDLDKEAYTNQALRHVLKKLHRDLAEIYTAWQVQMNVRAYCSDNFEQTVNSIYAQYRDIKPPIDRLDNLKIKSWYDNADKPNSEWRLLKASTLFYMQYGGQKLPWWMAMPELCYMKAMETSPEYQFATPRTVVDDIYIVLKPNPRMIRDEEDRIYE